MKFLKNQFYHVYNQGNNRRKVFFTEADYDLFLFKLKTYINPFAQILAYCIMPNHYHILLYVKKVSMPRGKFKEELEELQKQYFNDIRFIRNIRQSRLDIKNQGDFSLESSIGVIQRSYTRYINVKKGWSGSIFRNHYNAKDGWTDNALSIDDIKFTNNLNYIGKCIQYIHQNPVKADLCNEAIEWEFSSALEHKENKGKGICDLEILGEIC